MPAATTHIEFAKDVNSLLPEDFKVPQQYLSMYYLGSQGPDIFFFSRGYFLPGSLKRFGNLLHDERVQDVIVEMHNYTDNSTALKYYYYGYLTHYALDSNVHPMVNYYAHQDAIEKGCEDIQSHFELEAEIDVWALKRKNKSIYDYNAHNELAVSKKNRKRLGTLYNMIFLEFFNQYVPARKISESVRYIPALTSFLKPDSVRKYRITSAIEDRLKQPKLISGMMLVGKGGKDYPIFNQNHDVYNNIDYPSIVYNNTLEENYDNALQLALKLITDFDPKLIDKDFSGNPLVREIL